MSGNCTVTPGKIFNNELVNDAKLNLAARPIVQVDAEAITDRELSLAGLVSKLGDRLVFQSYLLCGNFDRPFWNGVLSGSALAGVRTSLCKKWHATAVGGDIAWAADAGGPDAMTALSAKLTGASGVTTVDFGQDILSWISAFTKEDVVFSVYIQNQTGGPFTPQVLLSTADAIDDFSAVTLQSLVETQEVNSGTSWVRITATFDGSELTNIGNGLRLQVRIPSGNLNAATKSVAFSQAKLERGTTPTAYMRQAADVPFDLSSGIVGSLSVANGGTGAATRTAALNAIAPASPAKGDLMVCDGTNWVLFQASGGNNGDVLTKDSAQTLGIKFAPAAGMPSATTKGTVAVYDGSAWTILAPGANGKVLGFNSGTATGLEALSLPSAGGDVAIFADIQNSGTAGQTMSTGWNTLRWNTEEVDTGSFASLSGNQITVSAGVYEILWWYRIHSSYMHATRLKDATADTYPFSGLISGSAGAPATGCAVCTFTGSTAIEILAYLSSGCTEGAASISGVSEKYGQLFIRKRS